MMSRGALNFDFDIDIEDSKRVAFDIVVLIVALGTTVGVIKRSLKYREITLAHHTAVYKLDITIWNSTGFFSLNLSKDLVNFW